MWRFCGCLRRRSCGQLASGDCGEVWRSLLTAVVLCALVGGVQKGRSLGEEADPNEPASVRIEAALAERVDLELIDTPLGDVAAYFSEKLRVPVEVDAVALQNEGLAADMPVSVQTRGLRWSSALEQLCQTTKLTWEVRHGRVRITTDSAAESHLFAEVYQVTDLCRAGPALAGDLRDLRQLLTATVAPESWSDAGGTGEVQAVRGALLVRQTWRNHKRIAALLAQLRAAVTDAAKSAEEPVLASLEAALLEKTDLQLVETPLEEALQHVAQLHSLPLFIDRRRLEEEGIDSQSPITLHAQGEPLRQALSRMLEQHGCNWCVAPELESVVIAPASAQRLQMKILRFPADQESEQREDLANAIEQTCSSDQWESYGGQGTISFFRDLAVVMVNRETLEEVEHVWPKLTQQAAVAETDAPVIMAYAVRRTSPEELGRMLLAQVSPLSWSNQGGKGEIDWLEGVPSDEPPQGHADHGCSFGGGYFRTPPELPFSCMRNPVKAGQAPTPILPQFGGGGGGSIGQAKAIKAHGAGQPAPLLTGTSPENLPGGWLIIEQTPQRHRTVRKFLQGLGVLLHVSDLPPREPETPGQ